MMSDVIKNFIGMIVWPLVGFLISYSSMQDVLSALALFEAASVMLIAIFLSIVDVTINGKIVYVMCLIIWFALVFSVKLIKKGGINLKLTIALCSLYSFVNAFLATLMILGQGV